MIEQGFVHNVYTRTAGSQALSSAAVGATTIFVQDAADFPETGGQVSITSLDSVSALDVKITYDYISADLDLDTITLATPLESALAAGDRVDVWPVAVTKLADVMLIDTEEPVTARVEHSIVNLLPEGVRDPAAQEQAVVRLADDDWWLTNLPVREPTIQSPNFDEAGTGFQVGAEAAQFQNMNVVDSLGVDALAVNNLSINGQDLETELFDAQPKGTIYYANISTNVPTADITTTRTLLYTFNMGELLPNRRFLVFASFHAEGSVAGDSFDFSLYYDTTGAVPTNAAPGNNVLDGSISRWITPQGNPAFGSSMKMIGSFTTDASTWTAIPAGLPVYMGLTAVRTSGTGFVHIYMGSPNRSLQLQVLDVGSTLSGYSNDWRQTSPTPAATNPTGTFTKTYWTTDTGSYDWNDVPRVGDPTTPDMYQGRYDATHGNTRSVAIFNSAQIRADTAGATIKSCKLTFRVKHAHYNTGLDVRVSWHNWSTLPATQGQPATLIASRNNSAEGSTYTIDLGVTFGNNLRDGVYRGTVFYGPDTRLGFFGYLYGGAASTSRPRLTITYTK
jgi:hypothetical protein